MRIRHRHTGLWWSNEDGWVDKLSATIFSAEEVRTLRLPMGGEWEKEEDSSKGSSGE